MYFLLIEQMSISHYFSSFINTIYCINCINKCWAFNMNIVLVKNLLADHKQWYRVHQNDHKQWFQIFRILQNWLKTHQHKIIFFVKALNKFQFANSNLFAIMLQHLSSHYFRVKTVHIVFACKNLVSKGKQMPRPENVIYNLI